MQLPGSDGDQWQWGPAEFVNDPNVQFPFAFPDATTTFSVDIANICGVGTDEVTVVVRVPEAVASADGGMCRGNVFEVSAEGNDPNSTFQWSPAELVLSPAGSSTGVFPNFTQTFTVFVTDSEGCTDSDEVTVYVTQPPEIDAGPDRSVAWLDQVRLLGSTSGQSPFWTPSDPLSCDTCLTPTLEVLESGWYVLHASDSTGCGGKDSTYVEVYYPVYVPNTFTPNNDGVNDVFQAVGEDLRGFWMKVFNRWGEQIFLSEDPSVPWRGEVGDGVHYAPDGMYRWQIRIEEKDGPLLLEGQVFLLR